MWQTIFRPTQTKEAHAHKKEAENYKTHYIIINLTTVGNSGGQETHLRHETAAQMCPGYREKQQGCLGTHEAETAEWREVQCT